MVPLVLAQAAHGHTGPTTASSAAVWDGLFGVYFAVAAVVVVGVLGWLGYALWRFRAAPGEPAPAPAAGDGDHGSLGLVVAMAGGIAAVLFALSFGTLGASDFLEHPPEAEDGVHIEVTGFRFGWRFNYTDLGFGTLGELRVPVGRPVLLHVTSQDVFHNFAVPQYRVRIDAMPGHVNQLWFEATQPGTAEAVCVELCGAEHARMKATLIALPPAEFDAWAMAQEMAEHATTAAQRVEVTLTGGGLEPREVVVASGAEVRLRVVNHEAGARTFRLAAPLDRSLDLAPGGEGWLNFTLADPADAVMEVSRSGGVPEATGFLRAMATVEATVVLGEFSLQVEPATLPLGTPVHFRVANDGEVPHDFLLGALEGPDGKPAARWHTPVVEPGEAVDLYIVPDVSGPLDAWCGIPGHAQLGMKQTLEVRP